MRTGDHRASQVLVPGEPRCAYALFLDPGRTAASGHTTTAAWPPFMATTRAPTIRKISGLDSRAWARAVYASSLGLPQDDARLASGCLASFPGGIDYPQGSNERFPVCFLHPVLPSPACLTQRQIWCLRWRWSKSLAPKHLMGKNPLRRHSPRSRALPQQTVQELGHTVRKCRFPRHGFGKHQHVAARLGIIP